MTTLSPWKMILFAVLAGLCIAPAGRAQSDDAQVWETASFGFRIEDSTLTGPGAQWLATHIAEADSILVGEQHGIDGVAAFTAALQQQFQPDVLVLEAGPWISAQLSARPSGEVLADAPYALAFDYDGDIALIEQFRLSSSALAQIWGVDQSVNSFHALAWLARTARSGQVRRTAQGLYLKAALDAGEYLRHDHQADLERLRRLGGSGSQAEEIADDLSQSMEIFVTWRSGARSESAAIRERYMISRHDAYRAAFVSSAGAPPRTLFKMGGAHIMEGETGPNGVPTLGEHIERQVQADSGRALHLGVRGYSAEQTAYPIGDLVSRAPFLLVDTGPLREAIEAGGLSALDAQAHADIYGFDALVYITPSNPAGKGRISRLQASFRTGLLQTLALSFWPAVILLLVAPVAAGVIAVSALRGRGGGFTPTATLAAASGLTLALLIAQGLALMSSAPGAAGPSPLVLAWLAPALALLALADVGWRGRPPSSTRAGLAGRLAWAGLLVWLAVSMHRFNFGAMLG